MTTTICDHCQTKNQAGTAECVACGRPLADSTKPEQSTGGTELPPGDKEEIERWLSQLPDVSKSDAKRLAGEDESLPAWLETVRAHADDLTDEEAEELMAFLHDAEPADSDTGSEATEKDSAVQAKMTAELPDWVAALKPEEQRPETKADEQASKHLAGTEEADQEPLPSADQLPSTAPLQASAAMKGVPDQLAAEELPEWLADQPEVRRPAESKETLPEWPDSSVGLPRFSAEEPAAEGPASVSASEDVKSEAGPLDARDEEQAESLQPGQEEQELTAAHASTRWPEDRGLADLEQGLAAALDLPEEEASQERVDQWLDLLEDLPAAQDPDQLEQLMMDSDIEGAEVPEWLRDMRLQQASGGPTLAESGPPETTGPLAGLRGILPAAAVTATGGVRRTAATLEMSTEQRQQAALLRQLTMVQPEQAPADESVGQEPYLVARTLLGLVLLSVIALGWLVPAIGELLPWSAELAAPPAAEQAWQAIEANRGRAALVAFEYTPSMAGELDSVAAVVLEHLAQNGSPVLTVSQIAAGIPMAEQATSAAQGLQSSSLGYLPGEATGLRALGACLAQICESLAGRELSEAEKNTLANVGLIFVLSADRDSLVGWVEQVGAQVDTPMIAGITQAMGPVARPYLLSDQFAGLIEGMPVAAAYAETFQVDDVAAEELTSLTLAQWLVIGALLAGAIYFGLATPAASAVTQAAKK